MNKKQIALFIPAGGLDSNGLLPEFVKARLDSAIKYYFKNKAKNNFILIVSGRETPYKKPLLDEKGFSMIESDVMAKYLINKGIERRLIRIEKTSIDTLGGIYFSKILFIKYLNVKEIVVFTSEFHMERVKLFFKWIYGLKPSRNYLITFIKTTNQGLTENILNARSRKEKASLKVVKGLIYEINTEKKFNNWLFTEHAGYSYGLKMFDINKSAKKSY